MRMEESMQTMVRLTVLALAVCLSLFVSISPAQADPNVDRPVLVGLDGEFGLAHSTSAEAIERGILTAIDEINRAGGVLGGRQFKLVTKENHSIAARGIRNIKEFAAMPDIVAVFGGRFSPVLIEELPILKETKTLLLAPWSSADGIIDNCMTPNFAFRLSLRDSLAMPFMLTHAADHGFRNVGLLLTNTAWGRSNLAAAERYFASGGGVSSVGTAWYNWRDQSLIDKYAILRKAGAQAIILVANDDEGATLVREIAALPKDERLPLISHWGVTGGSFAEQAGPALNEVDFSVIQTFSFFKADPVRVAKILTVTERLFGISKIGDIVSPVGFAHAYDLTHILARAITKAGTADRAAVRDALELVTDYKGLVRDFPQPFTATNHDALGSDQLFMARYRADGMLIPEER